MPILDKYNFSNLLKHVAVLVASEEAWARGTNKTRKHTVGEWLWLIDELQLEELHSAFNQLMEGLPKYRLKGIVDEVIAATTARKRISAVGMAVTLDSKPLITTHLRLDPSDNDGETRAHSTDNPGGPDADGTRAGLSPTEAGAGGVVCGHWEHVEWSVVIGSTWSLGARGARGHWEHGADSTFSGQTARRSRGRQHFFLTGLIWVSGTHRSAHPTWHYSGGRVGWGEASDDDDDDDDKGGQHAYTLGHHPAARLHRVGSHRAVLET
eukprot:gene7481-626_t